VNGIFLTSFLFFFPRVFGLIRGEERGTRQRPSLSLRKKEEALGLLFSLLGTLLKAFTHDQCINLSLLPTINLPSLSLCALSAQLGLNSVLLCGQLASSHRLVADQLLGPRQHGRSQRDMCFRPAAPISLSLVVVGQAFTRPSLPTDTYWAAKRQERSPMARHLWPLV
jgi:hypothetical protein